MKMLHCLDIFPGGLRRFVVGVFQLSSVEKLCGRVCVCTSTSRADRLDQFRVNLPVTNSLHHSKVFQVVVGLEECIAGEEFHDNAADAPNVARKAPTELEDDLRCSIMSC